LALWKGAFRLNSVTNAVKSHEPVTAAPVTPVAASTATTSAVSPAENVENNATQPANSDAAAQPEMLNATPNAETATYVPRRSRPFARSRTTTSNVQSVNTIENAPAPQP